MCLRKISFFVLAALFVLPLYSQQEPSRGSGPGAVYMVSFRTHAHVRYSKPEVFHGFAADLRDYLKQSHVPLTVDPDRGAIETESPMSVDSMLNIARQLGASTLLFVTVDRPLTKWIKVTIESYDADGKKLWSEESSDGGGMSGKGGYTKTLGRIREKLSKRLGGPGLPVEPAANGAPASPAREPES